MSKELADNAVNNLDAAIANMRHLYNELTETNPIAAEYVLEQLNEIGNARNKMANVAGLL